MEPDQMPLQQDYSRKMTVSGVQALLGGFHTAASLGFSAPPSCLMRSLSPFSLISGPVSPSVLDQEAEGLGLGLAG